MENDTHFLKKKDEPKKRKELRIFNVSDIAGIFKGKIRILETDKIDSMTVSHCSRGFWQN